MGFNSRRLISFIIVGGTILFSILSSTNSSRRTTQSYGKNHVRGNIVSSSGSSNATKTMAKIEMYNSTTTATSVPLTTASASSSLQQVIDDSHDHNIPRHIHVVYVSPYLRQGTAQELPNSVIQNVVQWQQLHPNWVVTLWNDTMIQNEFGDRSSVDFLPILTRIPITAWISDVVRIAILQKYGGFYFDSDILPLKSLYKLRTFLQLMNDEDNTNDSSLLFSVCENPRMKDTGLIMNRECQFIGNSVIGSTKNHPTISIMLETAMQNTLETLNNSTKLDYVQNENKRQILNIAGPKVWTKIALPSKHKEKQQKQQVDTPTTTTPATSSTTTMLPSETFFPCLVEDRKHCIEHLPMYQSKSNIFGMHSWDMSWS